MSHVFAGNPLDRADAQRRDASWVAQAEASPTSRFLPLWRLDVLVRERSGLQLGWVGADSLSHAAVESSPILLGLRDGVAHFAIDVSELDEPVTMLGLDSDWRIQDARSAATLLSASDAGILAQGRAQLGWHARHQFCAVCGGATTQGRAGQVRSCQGCGADHFPRTDPVAIMLISDGNRCLLGQSRGRMSRSNIYSALAGFIDQGESIEEAVRREVMEEAGVPVGEVRYHSSQPWPFPSSLMIGCHGRALSTDIRIDPHEMHDVRWFDRETVIRALKDEEPSLRVPGRIAIAHHLIRAWAEGDVLFDEV